MSWRTCCAAFAALRINVFFPGKPGDPMIPVSQNLTVIPEPNRDPMIPEPNREPMITLTGPNWS